MLEVVVIETKITFDGKKFSEDEPVIKSKPEKLSPMFKKYLRNELAINVG